MGCCEGELLEKWCGDNEPMKVELQKCDDVQRKESCDDKVLTRSSNNEPMKECGGNELLKKESGDDVQMTNELLNMVMMSS